MKLRYLREVVLVVGAAVTLSACSVAPYAAKVNGKVITQSQLMNEMNSMASNKAFVAQIQKSQGSIYGSGTGTFSSKFTAQILNRRISITLVDEALSRLHLKISPSVLSVAYPMAASAFGGTAVFSAFSKSYQAQLIKDTAAVNALEAHLAGKQLTPSSINSYYNHNIGSFTEYCSSEILVPTQAEASTLATKIAKGAAFPAVASKYSKDTTNAANGGVLGCGLLSQYTSAFGPAFTSAVSSLGVNQVSKPFQGIKGWYLVDVTSKPVVPEAQATPTIVSQLLGSKAGTQLVQYVQSFAKASNIYVNPAFGSLSLANGQVAVLPPSQPSATAQKGFFPTPS